MLQQLLVVVAVVLDNKVHPLVKRVVGDVAAVLGVTEVIDSELETKAVTAAHLKEMEAGLLQVVVAVAVLLETKEHKTEHLATAEQVYKALLLEPLHFM